MMTVHEVSALTGVSIRALQYYDKIGLLRPAERSEAGYRLYDEAALETLQQILLFRELEFPLREIGRIIGSPAFDRDRALDQQIELLRLKKERLEGLIALARGIRATGGKQGMDFSAFDTKKIDEYAARAKETWGDTAEFREYEQKARGRTRAEELDLNEGMMRIFAEFGRAKGEDPAGDRAQRLVGELRAFITEHFYNCSRQVLSGLGRMYAAGGEMTENIDRAGGEGTAAFVSRAIKTCCGG